MPEQTCSFCNLRIYPAEPTQEIQGVKYHTWCARSMLYRAERDLKLLMNRIDMEVIFSRQRLVSR